MEKTEKLQKIHELEKKFYEDLQINLAVIEKCEISAESKEELKRDAVDQYEERIGLLYYPL